MRQFISYCILVISALSLSGCFEDLKIGGDPKEISPRVPDEPGVSIQVDDLKGPIIKLGHLHYYIDKVERDAGLQNDLVANSKTFL